MWKLWRWYQRCMAVHPVKTQVISSGVLWGLGDVSAQAITHSARRRQQPHDPNGNTEFEINWKRVATTSMFGFAFVGPLDHYWYEHLDRFVRLKAQLEPKSLKFVTAKVAADGLIFGPLDLLIFFSYIGLVSGKSMDQVKVDVMRDFRPGLVVEACVWPVVQFVNFRFVPVKYQLLYVNLFCLLESSFLSWLEQQGDAPWKQWFTCVDSLQNQKGQT